MKRAAYFIVLLFAAGSALAEWPQLGGNSLHSGIADTAPRDFSRMSWTSPPLADEEFNYHASPAIAGGRVFVSGRGFADGALTSTLAIAFDAATGNRVWTTPLPPEFNDSWSAAAVDVRNQRVLFAAGNTVYALDIQSGDVAWETTLQRAIVNASPTVTDDRYVGAVGKNRALITDFSTSGSGRVYAINIDLRDDVLNPYDLGEVVWSRVIGVTSGATAAYENGLVIVPSSDFAFSNAGVGFSAKLSAYDIEAGGEEWVAPLGPNDGFFGGVAIRNGFAFAATFDFTGSGDNSRLFKVSLMDGSVTWSVPCERTASIPVVANDGNVFLSAGLFGFGSAPRIQAFADLGDSAEKIWDSFADTQGTLVLGGWTAHPVLANNRLITTVPSSSGLFDAFLEAVIADVSKTPTDVDFLIDAQVGAGGSPAIDANGLMVSVGSAGVFAFSSLRAGDTNCDGAVTVSDIGPFVLALTDSTAYATQFPNCDEHTADVDGNGSVTVSDIGPFIQLLTGA